MNLAKISANGQITVPVEIRRLLGLKSGDKILFYQKQDGEVVLSSASTQAIRKAQSAFLGWISVIKLDIILFSNIMEKGGKYLL